MCTVRYLCLVALTVISSISSENCDNSGVLLYEDLGCTPHSKEDTACPTKYSCPNLGASDKYCYFKGKGYEVGQQAESGSSCHVGCSCNDRLGHLSFTCAILDCPEWLGFPLNPGCYRTYSLNHCCSNGQKCPPFDDVAQCTVEGQEYREGEKFSPKNSCLQCVCRKGFKGIFEEPFCQRYSCGEQLSSSQDSILKGCAPFYGQKLNEGVLCCPSGWVCPTGSDVKKPNDTVSYTDETCKFGSKVFTVGQDFQLSNYTSIYGHTFEKVVCSCKVPPLLTCLVA